MTQAFHISVTPIGGDEYLVRTERVAPGVPLAEEQATWPVEEWLSRSSRLMRHPLAGLLADDRPEESLFPPRDLVALGQELYTNLFQGRLRESWMMAEGIARNRQEKLSLRLGLKGPRLPRLPWEVLHDGDRALCSGTDILFSRYQPTSAGKSSPPQRLRAADGQVRVLMVLAAPGDRESLELRREAAAVRAELQAVTETGAADIELTVLEQPDRASLTQALEQGRYQVLHYAGHSNFGASGGDIYLVNRKTGLTETLSGKDLAGLLANNGICTAVFNSCRGAGGDDLEDPEGRQARHLADALLDRGVPGILAMAESIPDEVAFTLTRLFYRNLKLGYPVDLSLGRARAGLISAYGSNQLYWALPVLYLQPEFDGYLTVSGGERPAATAISRTAPPPKLAEDATLEDILEEIEYDDRDEDPTEEDKAVVADLLRRLNAPKRRLAEDPAVPAAPAPRALSPHRGETAAMSPATSETITSEMRPTAKRRIKRWVLPTVAVVAIAAVAGGIGWQRSRFGSGVEDPPPVIIDTNIPPIEDIEDLPNAKTAEVTAVAIAAFENQNWDRGGEAIEALFERGALNEALTALQSVDNDNSDRGDIQFLYGRLAWESLKRGDNKYSIDDARRYWETAVKQQPENVEYLQALGFAYYSEGNLDRAYQTWSRALEAIEQNPQAANTEAALNVQAGLALALNKQAKGEGSPASVQAKELRQLVMTQNPTGFTPNALDDRWIWTEEAIADWQNLGRSTM